MCLAVPGKIESISDAAALERTGKVNFGGILRDVNLAYVPEAKVGDYVIVHVGFALNVVDGREANELLKEFSALDELNAEERDSFDEIP